MSSDLWRAVAQQRERTRALAEQDAAAWRQAAERLERQRDKTAARAIELLSSMASVIAVATEAERRAIIQQLVAAVWVKPGEVVAIKTQPAWAALYDATAYKVGEATSAGLESALPICDAFPARWLAWQAAA